jgi:lysophosphatidylglycerol acyltransferase 1
MFLLLPLRKLHPNTYYWIEGKLFHWLLANVAMWSYTAGYDSELRVFLRHSLQ